MTKSTHKCEVVPVVLEPHPNADSLSIVRIWGYQVVVKTADWEGRSIGAYVVPDSVVPVDSPTFKFLENPKHPGEPVRVRAKKLRGIISYGLLIQAPPIAALGDDVAEMLGITRYEPPVKRMKVGGGRADCVPPPQTPEVIPHYDIDAFQRHAADVFVDGELVVITEKIDGANGRFVFWDGQMYCGSRNQWPADAPGNPWWEALRRTPALEKFCRDHPGVVVFGEVYGAVQDLHYGHKSGECSFAAFDLMRDGRWMNYGEALTLLCVAGIPVVPVVSVEAYSFDRIMELAEGPSLVPGAEHYREGVVVKPISERWNPTIGRAQLKVVSATYYENEGKEKPWRG
jgi:RNA ligase (TIGR02306 family)